MTCSELDDLEWGERASMLLDVGAKAIKKLMTEKEELERRVYALETENKTLAAVLDPVLEDRDAGKAALAISAAKIVELSDINKKYMDGLTAALVLIDYMMTELRHAGAVPSPALQVAHARFTENMKKIFPSGPNVLLDPIRQVKGP